MKNEWATNMIAMISPMVEELRAHAERNGPVTVGLAGCGQMGTDIVVQLALMPGLRLGGISEVNMKAAEDAAMMAGYRPGDVAKADSPSAIDRAIEQGKLALTSDLTALAAAGRIDVVIDATGNPNVGTLFALEAIKNGKHIVMLNVEADITIGRFLKAEAKSAGVVYTGAAGDEPACTLELISFAQSLGMKIVCAGKGKNNPLNFNAVPSEYEREARERNMNARMLVEFVDGSKTMVEMVAIANCTGLVPDKPGMHGPAATREELASVLVPKTHGGLLSQGGLRGLFHRQGGSARRVLHCRDRSPPRSRAHDRSQGGQGSVLHHRPALSPDEPRGAAFGSAGRVTQARRYGAA